ncbi:MAG: AEC family transporter [Methylotetracoccus sp.]
MQFLHILALMMPVIIPVALGQLFVRRGIFRHEDGEALLRYLLYATFPAVILDHLVDQPLDALFQPAFSIATLVFVSVLYAGVYAVYRLWFRRSVAEAAMAALCGSFVSAGIVGLPIMLDIIGPTYTLVPVIANTVISLVTAVPVTILLIQMSKNRGAVSLWATLGRTFLDVLKNPLVLSAIAGLLISLLAVPIPAWLHETFAKVGEATFATSLFAVGLGIDLALLRDNLRQITVLMLFRIVLSSAFGFLLAIVFDLAPGYALSFVIMASLPTAKSIPPIAMQYGVFVGQSVQVVTVTTLAMVLTMPIVCYLGGLLWPGIIR